LTADWDSLDRARRGDECGWRELVQRHHARLVSMALLITGCSVTAQDIAQEAFTRLLQEKFSNRSGTVGGWLSVTAYRLAVKERRRANKHDVIEGIDPPDGSPSPLDSLLNSEHDRHIAAAIRALDPIHREILVLRFYGEQSYEEIARTTSVPLGTVKSRIFYAVKNCQQFLRDRGLIE
jgi:RNA polymerase sigma-70 factor, ECF subfamily